MRSRRRRLLATLVALPAAILAGCVGDVIGGGGIDDIDVYNRTESTQSGTVTVDRGADRSTAEFEFSLQPEEDVIYSDPIPNGVECSVTVSVDDGPSRTWRAKESRDGKIWGVDIYDDSIDLVEGDA